MSIVRQLVQIAMVEAIRGRTLASDAVLDSNIAAIGKLKFKDKQPVIAVSVEETDAFGKNNTGFFGRPQECKLFVQTAVAVKATFPVQTGETVADVEVVEIGATDAAFEATLNILDRQWKQALTDPANLWGDRFRRLAPRLGRVMDTRITDPEGGRKYAARVYQIDAELIPEPDFGAPMPEDLAAILAAAAEIPDYADLARIWTDIFARAALTDEIAAIQAEASLSSTAFAGLGLGALDPDAEPFGGAAIAIEGRGEWDTDGTELQEDDDVD